MPDVENQGRLALAGVRKLEADLAEVTPNGVYGIASILPLHPREGPHKS